MGNLKELLEEQKRIELGHAEKLKQSIEKTEHRLVSALLETIIHDSMKHAALCQSLIDYDAGDAPVTMDVDMATAVDLHQTIKQHATVEEKMISRLEAIVGDIEDPRVKEIVSYLLQDERRHHSILQRISNLVDRDMAAYDEYLDLIQKYMVSPP